MNEYDLEIWLKEHETTPDMELDYFLQHAYHDMRFFYKTITRYQSTSYTYFGDMQANLFYVSDNLRDTFGFQHNLISNLLEKWKSCIHGERSKAIYGQNLRTIIEEKLEVHDLRYQVADKDGNVFWIRCCGSLQWDSEKRKPLFFAGRVTRQDESFTIDPVTNCPSTDTLQRHLTVLGNNGQSFRTIGFRLNGIAHINSFYGRNIADRLVREICRRIMDNMGDKLSLYRLPGIRCMALLERTATESDQELMDEIQQIVCDCYRDRNLTIMEPCSFATMHFPQPDVSVDTFLENMVSLIKIAHHDPSLPYAADSAQNLSRIQEASAMEMAIAQDVQSEMHNFRAVVQLIVSAETGDVVAGETLMRWKYKGKDISPTAFISLLEKDRKICVAGRWIFEEAVKACARIVPHIPDFYLSVNLSLQQLYDEKLAEFIPQVLKEYQLDGCHIVVEMTESCMDLDPRQLMELMNVCHSVGVRLALDDFGTGYSSLRVLLKYPIDVIKLDRSLLLEMTDSEDKSNFINSVVYACHQFGKKVCMEGVEDSKQLALTKNAKCDMIQGFYFYRPTDLTDVYKVIREEYPLEP